MKSLSFILCVLLVTSCQQDVNHQTDDKGVAVATPYFWKKALHKNDIVYNGRLFTPIYYKNGILIPMTDGESHIFSLINADNGKTLWEWDDQFFPKRDNSIDFYCQNQNLLAFQDGSRSYCLNMGNGSTFWKYERDRSFRGEMGISGDKYYNVGPIYSDDGTEMAAFVGDIKSGENITPKIRMDFPNDIDYPEGAWGPKYKGGVIYLNTVPDDEKLLLVSHHVVRENWLTFDTYFSLYNVETEDWIWKNKSIFEEYPMTFYFEPVIKYGKIYANVGTSLVCHDIVTGKQIWVKNFNGNFFFTGYIIEDGKVIANNEDTNMYALNAETGAQLWSTPTAGTSSRMSYLNGVVYMVGGSGGGRLFAIEAATGKMLWRIDAGLLGEGYGARFRTNAVYVLPARDDKPAKVTALSNLYAYCFKAER